MITLLKRYRPLLLLLGLGLMLRLPSLTEPAWYGDETIYLTIGQGIRKGLTLYRDITDFPNKPPFIYLVAALTGSVFWFRTLLLLWNGVTTVVIYRFLQSLVPKRSRWWLGGTLVFVLLTSLPTWEGTIANAEIFMILPTTIAMWLLWSVKLKAKSAKHFFWAGVFFSVGFLFKIPVATEIFAALLFFFVFPIKTLSRLPLQLFKDQTLRTFLVGLALPVALALGFHALQGVPPLELVRNALGSTWYVSAWKPTQTLWSFFTFASLSSRFILLAILTGILYRTRFKLPRAVVFTSLWFLWALFGALLSARPYPHYLLQIAPAFVLLSAVGLHRLKKNWVALLGIALLALVYWRFEFRNYPTFSYYHNFILYLTGRQTQIEYYNRFDRRMERNYEVASYLRTRTLPHERIYVWGTEPDLYFLSERLPVGRLTTSFHVEDLNEYERLGKELEEVLPRYIVLMTTEPRTFPELTKLLQQDYFLAATIAEANIYRLTLER